MLQIPTAEEARKQVEEMQSELGQKLQEEVTEAIKEAIDALQTSCSFMGTIPSVLVQDLEKKGYTVTVARHFNDFETTISW